MAIESEQLNLEKKKLKETKEWIKDKTDYLLKEKVLQEEKVKNLKKSVSSAFSTDLLLAEKKSLMLNKNLSKYEESYNVPYFARIDFKEKGYDLESFYIGKFGLNDNINNEEVVIDWRAPVANLYYNGTFGESYYTSPNGVINGDLKLKRKFLIKEGTLVDAFDEGINELILKNNDENQLVDEFLKVNLEENSSTKLKDVVATIQKEQNEIIRAYKNKPIIIQGSAGSGKTTVALHRLAYLVYQYENKEDKEDILVIAPNNLFLDYISQVLPNLGVEDIIQSTFYNLCAKLIGYKGKIYSKDERLTYLIENTKDDKNKYIKALSKIKGSFTFKTILDRYSIYIQKQDIDVKDIKLDQYTLFSAKEIKRLYIRDLSYLSIKERKEEIKRYFKRKVKDKLEIVKEEIERDYSFKIKDIKMLENLTEEEKRSEIIKTYDERDSLIKSLKSKSNVVLKEFFKKWQSKDIILLYRNLLSDKELFNKITDNQIPQQLVDFIIDNEKENIKNKIIDSEDLPAILYLKIILEGLDKNFFHIIVDEAQDYSLFEFEVIKKLSKQNSITIVGDLAQGIYDYKGIESWEKVKKQIFNEDVTYVNLTQSYRSTVEIIDFANKVLEKQNLNIIPAKPVLRHGEKPKIITFNKDNFIDTLENIVDKLLDENRNYIALICKTQSEATELYKEIKNKSKHKWSLFSDTSKKINNDKLIIPSYMTKGLEFDGTIIYNCTDDNYKDTDIDKKLLYVNLTRALHKEYILNNMELIPSFLL